LGRIAAFPSLDFMLDDLEQIVSSRV